MSQTSPPTPTPAAAGGLMPQDNQNSLTLDAIQAELDHIEYGFAPLLELDDTRLVVETGSKGEIVRLAYPPQPDTPADWVSADSFVLSYSVRDLLLGLPHVRRISVGTFERLWIFLHWRQTLPPTTECTNSSTLMPKSKPNL